MVYRVTLPASSKVNQIRLGLPKGSLNTIGRGNTAEIFTNAGYELRGYEPGKESDKKLKIVNDPEIIAFLCRPQSAPVELSRGLLDVAIVGEDWVSEESVNSGGVVKIIGDLEYGQTKLVIGVPNNAEYETLTDFFRANKKRQSPILAFTEYPNLTRQWVMRNKGYRESFGKQVPLVQVRGLIDGNNRLVQIINSDGVTEGYMEKGADFIVDNTQTGSTLKEYGLRELETIMLSSSGLYAGPSCIDWKKEKAQEVFDMLKGAIVGKRYFDVKFNIPNVNSSRTRAYLIKKGLCADEPTITAGQETSAFNILILKEKFPDAVRTLRKDYGATSIVQQQARQYIER
jgi:ATP phosphoribosyltransferase